VKEDTKERPALNADANPFVTERDTAVFWSGRTGTLGGPERAAEIALMKNGKTLEMLLAERNIAIPAWDGTDKTAAAWREASTNFAEGASGTVRAVLGERVRPDSIWSTAELPSLMQNTRVTRIVAIDPETLKETMVFDRSAESTQKQTSTTIGRETDRHAAQAFIKEPQESAVKQHPMLASAYAAMAAIEKHAQASGLSNEQQSTVLVSARENIAKSIQQGQYPDIKIRDKKEVTSEHSYER
jgi:hypothetical protein